MAPAFNPFDWYWIVADGGEEDRFWSSAAARYVDELPEGWTLVPDGVHPAPTRIGSEADLSTVLAAYDLAGPVEVDRPLELVSVASARLAIYGWDVTSIDRTSGLSIAFVADTDTVWVFFDAPQPDTEYLVTPGDGVTKYADYIEVSRPGLAAVSLIVQRII